MEANVEAKFIHFDQAANRPKLSTAPWEVKDKMMAGGFHFPFPAFGSMEASGNGYQFKPVAA